ncbi:GNAT family N-acetyltransferase [Streptomyces sp. NBC_01014]|uniref:GNAT family N-acetyltransferase n=1 Tax=Streptomyces sp. NBC_01014 TaxID=2903719 RepID=UPI00387023B6|nr:GNAT family N-acetyltransferase [Streptomyces sp. NBC_01014]
MDYLIRPVRAEEWLKVKELRLMALEDPAAPVAYLETRAQAAARPDSFWQDRAKGASHGGDARQFVAENKNGEWTGTVVVLVEPAGTESVLGAASSVTQAHLVGVYVRPEFRGTGLTEQLFRSAIEWAWSLDAPKLERVRLFVHEANGRASGFYRKFGFAPSGVTVPAPGSSGGREVEMVLGRP